MRFLSLLLLALFLTPSETWANKQWCSESLFRGLEDEAGAIPKIWVNQSGNALEGITNATMGGLKNGILTKFWKSYNKVLGKTYTPHIDVARTVKYAYYKGLLTNGDLLTYGTTAGKNKFFYFLMKKDGFWPHIMKDPNFITHNFLEGMATSFIATLGTEGLALAQGENTGFNMAMTIGTGFIIDYLIITVTAAPPPVLKKIYKSMKADGVKRNMIQKHWDGMRRTFKLQAPDDFEKFVADVEAGLITKFKPTTYQPANFGQKIFFATDQAVMKIGKKVQTGIDASKDYAASAWETTLDIGKKVTDKEFISGALSSKSNTILGNLWNKGLNTGLTVTSGLTSSAGKFGRWTGRQASWLGGGIRNQFGLGMDWLNQKSLFGINVGGAVTTVGGLGREYVTNVVRAAPTLAASGMLAGLATGMVVNTAKYTGILPPGSVPDDYSMIKDGIHWAGYLAYSSNLRAAGVNMAVSRWSKYIDSFAFRSNGPRLKTFGLVSTVAVHFSKDLVGAIHYKRYRDSGWSTLNGLLWPFKGKKTEEEVTDPDKLKEHQPPPAAIVGDQDLVAPDVQYPDEVLKAVEDLAASPTKAQEERENVPETEREKIPKEDDLKASDFAHLEEMLKRHDEALPKVAKFNEIYEAQSAKMGCANKSGDALEECLQNAANEATKIIARDSN